jgi:tripartite-type tricarboxylate transporter receptor subunit TctC
MIHVPYKGSGPAIVGLLGNEVDFMFDSLSSSLPQIRAGKLRAIAMASKERSRVMPEVATVAEQGVPGFDVSVWYAVLAPAATPPAVVRLLNAEIIRAMRTPEAREKIEGYGYDLWGSSPAEGDAFVRSRRSCAGARW